MSNIDWSANMTTVKLHTSLVSYADSLHSVDDYTWPAAGGATLKHVVYYGDRRVRDWRWLWLRHKTVTRLLGSEDL
jgi:hypothetical protein